MGAIHARSAYRRRGEAAVVAQLSVIGQPLGRLEGEQKVTGSARYAAELRDPRSLRSRKDGAGNEHGPKKLVAPMPGKVVRILVHEKAEVEAGQGIVVVEAMKMQNEIKSPKKGVVKKIVAAEGANVNAGDVLAIVE